MIQPAALNAKRRATTTLADETVSEMCSLVSTWLSNPDNDHQVEEAAKTVDTLDRFR